MPPAPSPPTFPSFPLTALKQIEHAADSLIQALADCPEAALAFDDLATADSYTYSHSMRVATLGLLLGQRIDRDDGWVDYRGEVRHDRMVERMTQLTMGLLVHDIGKLAIPDADPQQARQAHPGGVGADQDPPRRRRVAAGLRPDLSAHPRRRARPP